MTGGSADYGAAIAKDPKDSFSLYGRGMAKLKSGDTAGANADTAAAMAINSAVAKFYADRGIY